MSRAVRRARGPPGGADSGRAWRRRAAQERVLEVHAFVEKRRRAPQRFSPDENPCERQPARCVDVRRRPANVAVNRGRRGCASMLNAQDTFDQLRESFAQGAAAR
eukprot:7803021-Pyramimonas_sp.AAC.1